MPSVDDPSADTPSAETARWSVHPSVLLGAGVVLVIVFARQRLIYNAGPTLVRIQFSPEVKWALTAGAVCLALVWELAPRTVRAVVVPVGGLCGFAGAVVVLVPDSHALTLSGYAVVAGLLAILLAGVLESVDQFERLRAR